MNQTVMEASLQFVNETEEIVAGNTSWNDDQDSSDSENAAISSVGNSKACETVRKPRPGKKTMGRVKIKMEYIKNKVRRYTTFSKRKTGIMKKAYELSALTGTQVMLLVASETGHVYTFATRKLQPIITSENGKALIQTCLNSPDPPFIMSQSLAKPLPQPFEQPVAIPNDSSTKPAESNSVTMEHKAAEPDVSKTAILPQLIPLTVDENILPSAIGQHVSVPLPVSIDSKADPMGNNSGNSCVIPGAMMLAMPQPQTSQSASCEPAASKLQPATQLKEIRPQQQQQQPVVYYRFPGSDVLFEVPVTPIASPMQQSNGARFVYQTPASDLLLATPTLPVSGLPSDSCLLSIPNTPATFAFTSPEGQQGDNALQQFFAIPAASQHQLIQSLQSSPGFLSEFVDGQFRLVLPSVRKDAT